LGKQSLDREQILKLLAAARLKRERDWLMILLAFNHGLRASEVIAIRRDDVRDGYLTVQRLKGSLRTVQPLIRHSNPLLSELPALFDYASDFFEKQKLFPLTRQRFWQLVQEYGERAGIPKHLRHPHVMKHSIAAQTIHTAGIENVRQHLGHKVMSSTGEYLKVTDEAASAAVRTALDV
jgi:integrase